MSFSSWIEQIPLEDLQAELQALEAQKAELESKVGVIRTALTLYSVARAAGVASAERVPRPARGSRQSSRQPAYVGIREVLASDPERAWKLEEIHQAMIQRGVAEPGRQDRGRLQLAASRMVEKGQIEKPSYGHYRLPPAPDDPLGRPWGQVTGQFNLPDVAGHTGQVISASNIQIDDL
jgi:hypothetical protein